MIKKSLAVLALAAAMTTGAQAQPAAGAGLFAGATLPVVIGLAVIVVGAAAGSTASH